MKKYPYVQCGSHLNQLGYVICLHILEDKKSVHFVEKATKKSLGQIICDQPHETIEGAELICERCAIEAGYIT